MSEFQMITFGKFQVKFYTKESFRHIDIYDISDNLIAELKIQLLAPPEIKSLFLKLKSFLVKSIMEIK